MKKLYRFWWSCGRMGTVEGLFVAEDTHVVENIGKEVYFGEILGKHSDIYGVLQLKDLEIISEDQEKISWLVEVLGNETISGYNPLKYINEFCYECGEIIIENGYGDYEEINGEKYCKECADLLSSNG